MSKNRRSLPEINAGSMADIAFLLLIFFLVTTTMDVDTGIERKLPPLPDEENIPAQVDFHKNNILIFDCSPNSEKILVETGADEAGNGRPFATDELKNEMITFLTNYGKNPDLSESPAKAVLSIRVHKKTQYETYVKIQDQISIAYKELRNNEARKRYSKKYENLNKEQQDIVKKEYPMRVSESIKE
jgi:biopolymer transport protein ExbD